MSVSRASVKVEGLTKLLKKLQTASPIYAKPWRTMMAGLALSGHRMAQERAPRATGYLASRMTRKVQQTAVPLWLTISNDARSEDGVRYGFVLDAGHRRPAGRSRRAQATIKLYRRATRKSTRRWFRGVLTLLRKEAKVKIAETARAIEAAWSR